MAHVKVTCGGCALDYFRFIKNCHSDNDNFIDFLQAHGVVLFSVECEHCKLPCSYRSHQHIFFYCGLTHCSCKEKNKNKKAV